MEVVILVIHVILALAIIGVILLQPPENSSLGGLGGSNQMSAFSGRSQGNILTRTTAILAGLFIVTSLVLAILAGHKPVQKSILDSVAEDATSVPVGKQQSETDKPVDTGVDKSVPAKAEPAEAPTVPLAK